MPHTYTRTKAFLKDFANSLSIADKVIVTDIYAAREKDPGDISGKDLERELLLLGADAIYISDFDEIENFILKNCVKGRPVNNYGSRKCCRYWRRTPLLLIINLITNLTV